MARRGWGWDDWSYPKSKPKAVEGGIRSQSTRGEFGKSWWAKRWIKVLEGFQIGARLTRGRSYARNGQVVSIGVEKGIVRAKVQGSRPKPYDVTIRVRLIDGAGWSKVAESLGRQALFAAKLLAGEMPQDIEPVFQGDGLSLFPARLDDLKTECSCPDWSNPCKHIAAVYYLLGEEFDRDPFLIFTLRGLTRDELSARLEAKGRSAPGPDAAPIPESLPAEPLSADAVRFWNGSGEPLEDPSGVVELPREPAALPRRLGGFPFWRGTTPLLSALGPLYASASPRGLEVQLRPAGGADNPTSPEPVTKSLSTQRT